MGRLGGEEARQAGLGLGAAAAHAGEQRMLARPTWLATRSTRGAGALVHLIQGRSRGGEQGTGAVLGGRLRTRQEELGRGGVGLLRRKAAAWRPIWSKEAEADDGDGRQRRTPRAAALQFSMASMWFPVRERQGMRERGGKRDGKEDAQETAGSGGCSSEAATERMLLLLLGRQGHKAMGARVRGEGARQLIADGGVEQTRV